MYKDRSETYVKMLADVFIMMARFGLIAWLYYYLFKFIGGPIYGESYQTVIWSMFFYFSFMNINPRHVSREIQKDVKTGNVEVLFSKPINYLLYRFSYYIGVRLNIFILNTVLGVTILSFLLGIPETIFSFNFIMTFPFVFIFCFILSFLIYCFVGLLSFWLENILPINWIVDKSVMVLGGSFLPVAFFPPLLKSIAIWSPFGASHFITHTVYSTWKYSYLKLIGIQTVWVLVFSVLVYFIFKKAVKNASVNGG